MNREPSFKAEERTGQLNLNTLVGAIALAAIAWVGNKTAQNNDTTTKIEAQLPYMTQSVVELKGQISQLVTRAEVESRFSELAAKNSVLDKRLMMLEFEKKKTEVP